MGRRPSHRRAVGTLDREREETRARRFCGRLLLACLSFSTGVSAQEQVLGQTEILLADTNPGPEGAAFFPYLVSPDLRRAVFRTSDRLWATDGTREGTYALPSAFSTGIHWPHADRFYYWGADPPTPSQAVWVNHGIWVTDFTPQGTALLLPSENLSSSEIETRMVSSGRLNKTFLPREENGSTTSEIWVTPGNAAPLELLLGPGAGFDRIRPSSVLDVGSTTLLRTLELSSSGTRSRVFRTDGTAQGTEEAFVQPPPTGSAVVVGDDLYYLWFDERNRQHDLYRSDGSAGLAELVIPDVRGGLLLAGSDLFAAETGPPSSTEKVTQFWHLDLETKSKAAIATLPTDRLAIHAVSDWFLIVLSDPTTLRLRSMGALRRSGYTELVRDLMGVTVNTPSIEGDKALLGLNTPTYGHEPWTTDGTLNGTRVLDVCPGPCSSDLEPLLPTSRRIDGRSVFVGRESSVANSSPPPTPEVQIVLVDDQGGTTVEGASSFAPTQGPRWRAALGNRLVYFRSDISSGLEPRAIQLAPGSCSPAPTTLCLGADDRFRVEVDWTDFQGGTGTGRATTLTQDTGSFWFFDPANLELLVKVIDGRSLNGHFWVFFGSLSDVAYTLRVTDTETGRSATYSNTAGTFASRGDIEALPAGSARFPAPGTELSTPGHGSRSRSGDRPGRGVSRPPMSSPQSSPLDLTRATGTTAACTTTVDALCLGNRFHVRVSWRDFDGGEGTGATLPLTEDTGAFWFFDSNNIELVLKVLDGRALNGHFWVFYGALSNVEFEITVTDTDTGETRIYDNPSGEFASRGDTSAF